MPKSESVFASLDLALRGSEGPGVGALEGEGEFEQQWLFEVASHDLHADW